MKLTYIKTQNLFADTSTIIETAKRAAYHSVNVVLVQRNWLLGKRIVEEQLGNQTREELYGQNIITNLAQQLTAEYGSGFDFSSLYKYIRFYQCFPNILDAASPQSFLLTWTHYRILLQVEDKTAREWYANEAAKETWSTKTLQRNISSQYYYRLLKAPAPETASLMLTHTLKLKIQDIMKQFTFSAVMANNLLTLLQGYSKTIRLLLVMLLTLTVTTNAWAETHTIGWGSATGTAGTYTNFTATSGTVTNVVSFSTAQNSASSAPAYNSSSEELRLYYNSGGNGCSITLTPATGVTITAVEITASSTSYTPTVKYNVNGGDVQTGTWSSTTMTISGINDTTSLKIRNANTSNTQLRIKTIQITYTAAASCNSITPSLSYTPSSLSVEGTANPTLTGNSGNGSVTYSSSNTSVATVIASTGVVTAKAAGTTTITATIAANNGYCEGTATANVTVTADPYTVTLNAAPGTCAASVTEESAGAGVTLPTPTLDCGDWEFAGWKTTSAVTTETTTKPTLIAAGNYTPTSNITLYAVYQRIEGGGSGSVTPQTDEVTISDFGTGTSTRTYSATYADWTWAKNSGSNIATYDEIRLYTSHSMKISPKSGYTISSIVATCTTSSYASALAGSSLSGAGKLVSGSTVTITPTSGDIVITQAAQSRVSEFTVTYTSGSSSTTYYHSTPDCGDPCEKLGVATGLTVVTDFVQDGQTYVKFSWTPADNTKANATNQKLCFGKVGEAGTCVDDLEKNLTWTGDLKSKLEPGEYWWSIQALGDGVNYCDGDVVNGTNFTIEAPTYTVTWMVNGEELKSGVGGDTFPTNITSGHSISKLPNEPDAPAGCLDKVFVGWTTEPIDSEIDTPPSKLYKVSSEFPVVTENVTYYAVWADKQGGGSEGWVLKDIANIDSDDVVIITMTKNGTTYALYNHQGKDKAPSAASLSIVDDKITSDVSLVNKWNISNDNGNLTIYPNGTTETWLYCENDNNGVRVGTEENKIFTIEDNYLKNTATSRYVGVYTTNPDWRCYTGTTGTNIANQTLGLYTYQSSTSYSAYTTICDNTKATITYNLDGGTEATCEKTTVTKGEEFTLCNQTPTKEGYDFAGWSDGTKTYAAGATVIVDDHTTFYASWNAKSITITWDQNYTDCPEAATSTYIYDGEEIEIPADPTRVGYKFTGWFTTSTDGTQVTEVGETNKPTADVIYYAHWAELYTVTFKASGQGYAKQEFKYLSGETLQLPADPSAANYACDGYIFDGWSEIEKTYEDATKPTLISTPAITKDVTYYAVWKKATAEGAGETILFANFDDNNGTGGNDGKWSDNIATATIQLPAEWDHANGYGANQCIKLGTASKKGSVTTPALSQLSGNATLSFKAAAWDGSSEQTTLLLSIEGGGSLSQTSVTLTKGAWMTYEVTITGGTSNTQITFAGKQASNSRFFLDEVKVATSGSYNYTTSPSCGPTIVAKEGMWVTSSNGQSVKVNVPIAVKSFTNNATLTGTTANENFVVTPLENVGNGEHNVVVTYTPNAYDTKEDATITLTAKVGEETISTTTFTLNGRSLPEAFAVVVDKASTYFALPANMPEAGVYPGFNVTLNADKSAVVAAPKTHLYALKTVHKNRFDENGTCVRLEGNNTACLWATNAASGTHIRNWAQLNNADGAQYEWSLYTEDGDTYSISCAAVTEEGRILRMYGDNFGMYKSGASVFRLLPVECTEQPTNVLVSAARVAATIAWTNAATCDVKVYLKSNASLVKTLSGVASPVTVTELTETTEYTYTITPVGNVACEVSGEFKTTGPDIDIVEWMTDGIIIQVDKDEALNPKVVIKGEVEHNTGSGVMATELFFSKYFEAHGHNKLLAIYNGTGAPIDLSGYEIKSENGTLDLSQFGQTKGTVAPNEEIILVYYDATDNNNDNIPDYSAEPCAEEQEGYEKWNILTVQSVLAFSGRGSIGLYKDDELIDVIGSTFPSGELTKIGKSGNPDYCGEEEDVRLHIDGESVNDQSSFFCTNGDNIKTDEVETNYAISTNRCLLIRKNTVTSGEDAVTTNKAEAGATCGELSSTFTTLCSEWAGFRIGSGKSTSDEIKDATCDGLGYVGGFDYNKYYREFQTLDDSKTLDKFEYNLEENLYKLTIDNVAQYSCLNIQVQINDPVNGTVLTEETAQVPILVTAANTTTDELFSNIIDDDLDASRTRCSTCDVVVLDGATLTKAAAETANDVNQVRNLYVYPGGQLIVPETGNDYKVNSISFRRVEDAVANAQLSSNLNITASSEKPIYADVRVNAENWHWFTLPYDCNIADVTWVDGTPAKYGVDWFLSTYDGEKRATTQSGGCWAEFHGETIKAGVGYIVGIAGHPTKSKVKYELRFPMSKEVLAQEVEGTDKTVPVYAWGVDEDMRPTHKGWNLVGNPYLDYYQKNKLNSFGGLRLGGKYVLNQSTGYWEDSGKWDGVTGNLPYVVVPIDGGWSAYDQVLVSSIDLLPFTAYFVQVGNPETEDNGEQKDVLFDGDNRGRASIARRAPSSVSEQEEPVIVGVSLSNSKGESDMTSLVIDDKYTDEYEMNADFFKWFGDYYRYYTRPVVYTIGADKQQRAFNAMNEEQAAKPVSMGTYTAQNGEYTFSLDRRSDLTRVKEVWLHDATESAYINLMQEDYSFSTGKTDGTGRFTLSVTLHPKSPTDITDGMNGQVYVTSQQRMLYVNNLPQQARVWVYDAVGKLLVNESTNVYQRAYHVGQAGVYFVRVESQNGCETLQAVVE